MKRFLLPVLFLFILLLGFSFKSQAQENYRVAEINFSGNETISSERLREQMSTYQTSYFAKTILGEEPFLFSREIINADLNRLKRFYQREGFINASVTLDSIRTNEQYQYLRIYIGITENRQVRLYRVSFHYDTTAVEADYDFEIKEMLARLFPDSTQRFRDAEINAAEDSIMSRLANHGYPFSKVSPVIDFNREKLTAGVEFVVDPGPAAEFGKITIEGNDRLDEGFIMRHVPFREGDTYRREQLDKAQQQLFSLGHFNIATLRTNRIDSTGRTIPVTINLQEAPWLRFKIGTGYGKEDRFRVFTDTRMLSIPEQAMQLSLYVKHSYLEPYNVRISASRPSFITLNNSITLETFLRRQREPGYIVNRYGGGVNLWHRFNKYFDGTLGYIFERVDLDTASISDIEQSDFSESDLYNKSSIVSSMRHDDSEPDLSPTEGFVLTLSGKYSGVGFDSDYDFMKATIDFRRYQPIGDFVLAGKIEIGGIESTAEKQFIPPEDRYYSGGSNSIRGWARGKLGPIDDEDIPFGGKSLLELSLEFRYPIYGNFTGVIFSDAGNVWVESYLYRFDELRYCGGIGFRYKTPIGPIRLDIGQPFDDREKTTQFHISIGEAF